MKHTESLFCQTILISARSEKPDGCGFRLILFFAPLCLIIRRASLTTWQRDEMTKSLNLCPTLDALTSLGEHEKISLFLFSFHRRLLHTRPQIEAGKGVSLKLSPRLTDGVHFSFQLKWIQTLLAIFRQGGKSELSSL